MPQSQLQGLNTGLASEATFRRGRRAGCTSAKEEAIASAAHGLSHKRQTILCTEEHVFNWQSFWIDLGGEG